MNVALVDVDNTNKVKFPNLVLMKASTYYKHQGHDVKLIHGTLLNQYDKEYCQYQNNNKTWKRIAGPVDSQKLFNGKAHSKFFPDVVIKSKVFTWTKDKNILYKKELYFGGTGSPDITLKIKDEIDRCYPDYSLYDNLYRIRSEKFIDAGIGFTTRGCYRNCSFCFVPKKEGKLRPYMTIEYFRNPASDKLILLDNNILAHPHGIREIEKMVEQELSVDFNQGVDAHIIANKEDVAKLLSRVKYMLALRLACDEQKDKEPLRKAVELLNKHHCTGRLFAYTIIMPDVEESYDRIKFVDSLGIIPYAQCLRDIDNTPPNIYMQGLQRWVSSLTGFFAFSFEDYINQILRYDLKSKRWKEVSNRSHITKEWKQKHKGERHKRRSMDITSVKEIVDKKIKNDILCLHSS